MFSFNEIIKATDKFYALAMSGKLLSKFGAPPEDRYSKMWDQTQGEDPDEQQEAPKDLYTEMEENIWDQLQNEELANQFEAYLKSYKAFIDSLNNPKKFTDALYGNDEYEETWVDYLDALQKRYERLIGSPYLQLDADDPKWEESLDPSEIKDAIEEIAKEANHRMYDLARYSNISPDDIDELLENKNEEEIMASTHEMQEGKETDYANRMIGKQQEANKKSREKRMSVGKIGVENVARQRKQLADAIETETNAIKREELERRLKALPNPESYLKQLEQGRAIHRKKMEDPAYRKRMTERKSSSRIFRRDIVALAEKYDKATNENEKAVIKQKVVEKKKELLKKHHSTIDFDDEWVRNDPAWQAELDPIKIMDTYRKRTRQQIEWEKGHHQRRQTEKAKGSLNGLIIQYRERVNNMLHDVKRKLNGQIDKAPEMKPLRDAIDAAEKSGDAAKLAQAKSIAVAYIENFKVNHPLTKAVVATVEEMRNWRDRLVQLDESKVLNSEEGLSEDTMALIKSLMTEGIGLIRKYPSNGAATRCATDIVTFLGQRISS
jgi:hypothetical protein